MLLSDRAGTGISELLQLCYIFDKKIILHRWHKANPFTKFCLTFTTEHHVKFLHNSGDTKSKTAPVRG